MPSRASIGLTSTEVPRKISFGCVDGGSSPPHASTSACVMNQQHSIIIDSSSSSKHLCICATYISSVVLSGRQYTQSPVLYSTPSREKPS